MMRKKLALAALAAFVSLVAAFGDEAIFPVSGAQRKISFKPSENGNDGKSFSSSVNASSIRVELNDKDKKDKYVFVDFGHVDLAKSWPGGYLALEMEADRPAMRISACLANPASFWTSKVDIEGECVVKEGLFHYRFYLDALLESRASNPNDHLYILLHDSGKGEQGKATATISKLSLLPQTESWEPEKEASYDRQYDHKELKSLGNLYRANYERLVSWEAAKENPSSKTISLDGAWQKTYAGDLTWDYKALADSSWSTPDFKPQGWETVKVPEEPVEGQKGGHYLYRKTFSFSKRPGAKTLLRFEDISNYAEIYVNGRKASCQSSVRRRHDWVVEGGSRAGGNAGKNVKEMLAWRNFERCGIPCPFEKSSMPDGELSLLLPIYTGEAPWPMASDIGDLLVDGENVIALRVYGCPVKGFWIFKERDDRPAKGIIGILGDASLLVDETPALLSFDSAIEGQVDAEGCVSRAFKCVLNPDFEKSVASVVLSLDGEPPVRMAPGAARTWTAILLSKADFATHSAKASALDANGKTVDEKALDFPGTVWELRDKRLFVNGDPYFVRGINASMGIEWDNNRKVTRREWLRQLRLYQQFGVNTLRIEGTSPKHFQDALEAGMTVMAGYVPGSCDTTMMALGNLSKPDCEFVTDPHKEMAIMFSQFPNVLFWNTGNENHHTPGWNDRAIQDKFLETAQASIHRFDPLKRPTVHANLDCFDTSWFFTKGQDSIIGMNSYSSNEQFAAELKTFERIWSRPVVYTEWGYWDNEARAIKDRSSDVAAWERKMEGKMKTMRESKACVGGFLYAYHGELKDERGLEFLQRLFSPFALSKDANSVTLENTDVCPFRALSLTLVSEADAPAAEYVETLKPGEKASLKLPDKTKGEGLRLEIRYKTHRGLNHFATRSLESIGIQN